jgi:hypothetical protein
MLAYRVSQLKAYYLFLKDLVLKFLLVLFEHGLASLLSHHILFILITQTHPLNDDTVVMIFLQFHELILFLPLLQVSTIYDMGTILSTLLFGGVILCIGRGLLCCEDLKAGDCFIFDLGAWMT